MNKADVLVYRVLFPGKVGAVTFDFGWKVHIYSWISTACYCLPDTVNEHRTLTYKESARAKREDTGRSVSLTFWLSSSFLSAGLSDCDAAFLLCKGTGDRTQSTL